MKEIPQQPAQLLAGHAYTTEDSDQLGRLHRRGRILNTSLVLKHWIS